MQENIKAESLLFLKSLGLAPEPLLIIEKVPSEKDFFKALEQKGFRQGQEIGVRFSYTGIMEVPRSIGLNNFSEVFGFIKNYFRKGSIIIIHPFIKASYVGTHYFYNNQILINLIKSGIWEPSVAKNCDIFLLEKNKAKVCCYQKPREVYQPIGKNLVRQTIKLLSKDEIKILLGIFKKNKKTLEQLKKFPDLILEFVITSQKELVGMELEHTSQAIDLSRNKILDLFEVKNYDDIKNWDKRKDLLLTVTVFREDRNKFLKLIDRIKKRKKEVFVEYGLLSHPAILLREQGIKTRPYMSDFRVFTLNI